MLAAACTTYTCLQLLLLHAHNTLHSATTYTCLQLLLLHAHNTLHSAAERDAHARSSSNDATVSANAAKDLVRPVGRTSAVWQHFKVTYPQGCKPGVAVWFNTLTYGID
jgi:hypothetical protein